MQEMVLSQLLNSTGLMHAVFLAGLFLIVIFKKESIAIPGMFKLAYWLFAISIALPAAMLPIMSSISGSPMRGFRGVNGADVGWVLNVIYSGTGPALFALSLLCAFGSMFPRNLRLPPAPSAPVKHPLD